MPLMFCCLSLDSYIKPQQCWRNLFQTSVVYLLIPTSNHNRTHTTWVDFRLFISWFLHQTTTTRICVKSITRLFISWFLHQTTTENCYNSHSSCCLSLDSYIKPQLLKHKSSLFHCCLSLDSYIKPQLVHGHFIKMSVVYLLIPTSNHNWCVQNKDIDPLFISWFLHQTTTMQRIAISFLKLFISWFLHQTTTLR